MRLRIENRINNQQIISRDGSLTCLHSNGDEMDLESKPFDPGKTNSREYLAFNFADHNTAIISSGITFGKLPKETYATLNWLNSDYCRYYDANVHFDNKSNYAQIMAVIITAGSFNNLDIHTIGDFYAHTNYVDLWEELELEGKVSGKIPTFNNRESVPVFNEKLKSSLRSTNYPDKGKDDPYGHDNILRQHIGNQKGKDGLIIQPFGSKDSQNSKQHEKAFDLYKRSLKEKLLME